MGFVIENEAYMKSCMVAGKTPAQLIFPKVIYDYKNKREKDVRRALQLEADQLKLQHPGYVFANVKAGNIDADGSCTYTLIFKIKK